ncbi:MAG: divergent polysaccharide deacetylase family protein [bacterium]
MKLDARPAAHVMAGVLFLALSFSPGRASGKPRVSSEGFENIGAESSPSWGITGSFHHEGADERPAMKSFEVAVIIDDIGYHIHPLRELLATGADFTFSVLPLLPKTAMCRKLLKRAKREILLHIPMEPLTYDISAGQPGILMTDMSPAKILSLLEAQFRSVPEAVGAGNHMGSRFTLDRQKMLLVLRDLKRRGRFFIDNLVIAGSCGYPLALKSGMKAYKRDIFLDNSHRPADIKKQLSRFLSLARKTGAAVGVAHPRKNTIPALREWLPELRAAGGRLVRLSRLKSK